MANHLSPQKKIAVLSALVEGLSIRSIERMTGVHRDTIMRLTVEAGERAQEIMDERMHNLPCKQVQVDEIWTYVQKKQKRVFRMDPEEYGDQYVFVAMDADTKLVPLFMVAKRDGESARSFMYQLAERVPNRFQLSTDAFTPYPDAVERAFGAEIDYAQILKKYQEEAGERRYSPGKIISVTKIPVMGEPLPSRISTSYIERQNLTIRMQMRRFTRLTNAFSKKLDNLKAAVALHFFYYNFMRIHQTLRVTPAMEARITNHIWTWEEFLGVEISQSKAA
jgi:IS1 family transposase